MTIVMITHNNEIAQLADRIVRTRDGRIVGNSAGTLNARSVCGRGSVAAGTVSTGKGILGGGAS